MLGKQQNLFWCETRRYSDKTSGDNRVPQAEGALQLENNTAAGFYNVIRDSHPIVARTVTREFFRMFEVEPPTSLSKGHIDVGAWINTRSSEQTDATALVAITPSGTIPSVNAIADVTETGGEPDGFIRVRYPTTAITFVIEIKTHEDVSATQIGKYCNSFNIDPSAVAGIPWSHIHNLFTHLASELEHNDISGEYSRLSPYLLEMYAEYLQLQNLSSKFEKR